MQYCIRPDCEVHELIIEYLTMVTKTHVLREDGAMPIESEVYLKMINNVKRYEEEKKLKKKDYMRLFGAK